QADRLAFVAPNPRPRMQGIPIPGIPCDDEGFIAVDDYCRVPGVDGVFAAGDITTGLPKQGGLAARQADAAAEAMLAAAGFEIRGRRFAPALHGVLLTGEHLGEIDEDWQPPTKIFGR